MRASARATRESACCERQPRGNGNERGNVRCYSSERCRLCADGVSRVNFFVNVNNYFFFFGGSRGESYIYCSLCDIVLLAISARRRRLTRVFNPPRSIKEALRYLRRSHTAYQDGPTPLHRIAGPRSKVFPKITNAARPLRCHQRR